MSNNYFLIFYITAFQLLNVVTFGQNLVPNPSFESYSPCPTGLADLHTHCQNWSLATSGGSSDYFNSCASVLDCNVPTNSFGYQVPSSGNGYGGLYVYCPICWGNSSANSYREYMQVQLTSPLVAGLTYDFSMKVSRSDLSQYYTDAIGVHFSNTPVFVSTSKQLALVPQIENPSGNFIMDTAIWYSVTGSYVAQGGEEYLVIGNFNNDLNTNSVLDNPNANWETAYLFIDDVELIEQPCLIDAGADITVCEGAQVTLSGSGGNNYSWNNGIVDGQAFTPPIGTTTYTVTGTDANGCTSSDEIEVTVDTINVDAGADQTVCEGDQVTLSGLGAFNYIWNNGVVDGQPFSPSPGTTTYTVTGTDANGCTATDDVIITVNGISVNAGVDQTVCEGSQITLSGSGSSTYSWDNGVTDGQPFTPSTGTTTYTVTGTGINGCVGTDEVSITVIEGVNAGSDQIICMGSSVTLFASGSMNYSWDNGVVNGQSFLPPLGITTYTVTATGSNGCISTDQVNVTVVDPMVDAGQDQTICEGEVLILTGSGASTYIWDNGIVNGQSFEPSIGTTTYTVVGTDTNGCSNTDQVIIDVVSFSIDAGEDQQVCEGTEIVLSASGGDNYSWNNGVVDGESFVQDVGSVDYIVSANGANGCVAADTVTVEVEPKPIASFNYSPTQPSNLSPTVYFNNTSTGSTSYHWTFEEGASSSQDHPNYTYSDTGSYEVELIAYSDFGCLDTARVNIIFINKFITLYVPNTFTPNGDGLNDVFLPVVGGEEPSKYELAIFNRWGELIFHTNDVLKGWDGMVNNEPVQMDVYVWKIRLLMPSSGINNEEKIGHVTLMR